MGDPQGFFKYKRQPQAFRPVCERIKDYSEVSIRRPTPEAMQQASRCMDCGTPFCHWGCPIGNLIPEWNDAMFNGRWGKALALLEATNNIPEITGRICPAICEYACVLGINDDPVTIKENELKIIEYAFEKGLIKPKPPLRRTGKKIAVIGSGPAGLACAAQLNKAGHNVTVFEKDDKIGGILRYGIPDFKLEKYIIDRRIDIWKKEGIKFAADINIGVSHKVAKLQKEFDAICMTCGARMPRDLKIEGRDLRGIHFAMDYLIQSNKKVAGKKISDKDLISAKGKKVVIIGGGDTGADCVGVAHRQGASCVTQIELLDRPPDCRSSDHPWPKYPMLLKNSTSHEEGGLREWQILTKKFIGESGRIKKISCVKVKFDKSSREKCAPMKEIQESRFEIEADLAILAIGFISPERNHLLEDLKIKLNKRGNVATNRNFMTSRKGVFAAGDIRRGQSLVVWGIKEGRQAAYFIDKHLMGKSFLPPA